MVPNNSKAVCKSSAISSASSSGSGRPSEYHAWRSHLLEEFEAAYAQTRLPDLPDYGRVEDFLLKARRSTVE
jgi:hypothetical protein